MSSERLATAAEIIAGILGCPVGDVTAETPVGALPQWDSMAHLNIIMAFEKRLGRQLTAEETGTLASVGSFAALLAPGSAMAAT